MLGLLPRQTCFFALRHALVQTGQLRKRFVENRHTVITGQFILKIGKSEGRLVGTVHRRSYPQRNCLNHVYQSRTDNPVPNVTVVETPVSW